MSASKFKSIILFFLIVNYCTANSLSDTLIIKAHLTTITKTQKFRTHRNVDQLNKTAEYIHKIFSHYSDSVFIQEFIVNGFVYKNIICSFGTENKKRILFGAHYDVCDDQEGADDNASGVAGLLKLFVKYLNPPKLSGLKNSQDHRLYRVLIFLTT